MHLARQHSAHPAHLFAPELQRCTHGLVVTISIAVGWALCRAASSSHQHGPSSSLTLVGSSCLPRIGHPVVIVAEQQRVDVDSKDDQKAERRVIKSPVRSHSYLRAARMIWIPGSWAIRRHGACERKPPAPSWWSSPNAWRIGSCSRSTLSSR